MIAINTYQDIFYAISSIIILIVGILLAFSLYYLALTLHNTRKMTKDMRTRIEAFWEIVELLRDKLQVGGAVFKVAATGIKELAEHMKSFSEIEKKSKKKK